MAKAPKWYSIPSTLRMTQGEYRANITGMNVVFGAVLGFVLAGAGTMTTDQFIFVLMIAASGVVTILYLGSSPYKLFYAVLGAVLVASLPELLGLVDVEPMPKLQATLGVWLMITLIIEALPRVSTTEATDKSEDEEQ